MRPPTDTLSNGGRFSAMVVILDPDPERDIAFSEGARLVQCHASLGQGIFYPGTILYANGVYWRVRGTRGSEQTLDQHASSTVLSVIRRRIEARHIAERVRAKRAYLASHQVTSSNLMQGVRHGSQDVRDS